MPGTTTRSNGRAQAIRERDRHRCQNCQKTAAQATALEIHQIVPPEAGGTNRLSNHVLLCAECHADVHEGDERICIPFDE